MAIAYPRRSGAQVLIDQLRIHGTDTIFGVPGESYLAALDALYEKEGLPVQLKHLGNLVGYYTTEVGNVNEIVHMWGYTDLADRTKRRAAMAADPAWQAYLQKSREYMKHMNNKILVPTTFSPTK